MPNVISKSAHGNSFKDDVLDILKSLKNEGVLDSIQIGKRFGQFYTTYLIELKERKIAIFTTTSVRSDRIKENQWDAWGIKNATGLDTLCILVLPDILSEKEQTNYLNEQQRITESNYISMIDKIVQLKDLKFLLV